MRKARSEMHLGSIKKLQYTLCLKSTLWEIQGKTCGFNWKDEKSNPADILSEPLGVCKHLASPEASTRLEGGHT